MTPDELALFCARLCPKCLEASWNGVACMKLQCEYIPFEPALNHVLQPGHVLTERYFVGLVLGEGGFAITYRALDTDTITKVAIKELFPDGIVDRHEVTDVIPRDPRGRAVEDFAKTKEDFRREIEYVKTVNHTHIAKYLGDFEANNTMYLVTDYEEGSTLTEYMSMFGKSESEGSYKRLSFEQALLYLRPIMEALSFLHDSQKSVHRDVSPDNIFVRDKRGGTLIDFGSARRTGEGSRLQKAGFTPPEIVEGRRTDQTAASDVYSLAATLYWCCTGDFAWWVPSDEPPKFLSLQEKGVKCSDRANAAVTKALFREPDRRFQSVAAFERELLPPSSGSTAGFGEPTGNMLPGSTPVAGAPAGGKPASGQPISGQQGGGEPVGGAGGGVRTLPPKLNRQTLRRVIIAESLIIIAVLAICVWFYAEGSRICGQGCTIIQQVGLGMKYPGS